MRLPGRGGTVPGRTVTKAGGEGGRGDALVEARERRRRTADRLYRVVSGVFFLSLLCGVVGFAAYLVRMVWPVM